MQVFYRVRAKNQHGEDVGTLCESLEEAKAFCEELQKWHGTFAPYYQVEMFIGKQRRKSSGNS